MSNHNPTASSQVPRSRRWRPNAHSLAAAAAAVGGDPTPLLAIEAQELHSRPVDDPDGRARRGGVVPASNAAHPVVGRLLAVNVGLPRDVAWDGKTIRSAIWKEPVDGPRMVRRLNIDGDDQADRVAHGGEHRAVFVYQIESYRYWERELHRHDFTYGQFGENFTVQGLADADVCIGDRYRIGQAIFEVTQPRVTCFRVGIRMNEPAMPSLLVAHHRPGFYFRVLREGAVQAGDDITRLKTGDEQVSVAEIDGLLYLPNRSRRSLQRALRIPALSDGWKGSFKTLLERAQLNDPRMPARAAWAGFQPCKVISVKRESSAILSFYLTPTDGTRIDPPRAGQYVTVRLRPGGPDQPPLIRSYSLSSIAIEDGYRISVKREPGGTGSEFMHRHVREGDVIDVAAARGAFVLHDLKRPVVLVSAGIGATPVLAMLQELARARSTREIWWVHGARNGEEHAFGHEVDQLLASLPHVNRIVAYSRPIPSDARGRTFDTIGRLSPETIEAAEISVRADYYICGPNGFMRTLAAALIARGVPPEQVTTEVFGATAMTAPGIAVGDRRAPHQPAGPPGPGPAVTFARSNLTVVWEQSYSSLLELAEACDVPVGFGCRNGVCHYCETGMLTGDVTYNTEPLEPPQPGRVLVCCSRPTQDVTLEL